MGLEKHLSRNLAKREREHVIAQHEANVRSYWTEPARATEYATELRRRFEPRLFTNTILPANPYLEEFTKSYEAAIKEDVPRLRKEFVKELGPGQWKRNFAANWRETRNDPTIADEIKTAAGTEDDSSATTGCFMIVFWGAVGLSGGTLIGSFIGPETAGALGTVGAFTGAISAPYWGKCTRRAITGALMRSDEYLSAEKEFDTMIAPALVRAQTQTLEKLCAEYRASRGEVDSAHA